MKWINKRIIKINQLPKTTFSRGFVKIESKIIKSNKMTIIWLNFKRKIKGTKDLGHIMTPMRCQHLPIRFKILIWFLHNLPNLAIPEILKWSRQFLYQGRQLLVEFPDLIWMLIDWPQGNRVPLTIQILQEKILSSLECPSLIFKPLKWEGQETHLSHQLNITSIICKTLDKD